MSAPNPHIEGAIANTQPAKWKSAGRLILLSLLASAGTFATTLPTWIKVEVHDALQHAQVAVPGSDAAPAVSALALVALAAAVALRLANKTLRYVIVAVMALAGAGMMFSAYSVIADPGSASQANVGTETGTIGVAATYSLTVWSWVAIATGLLVTVSAVLLGLASSSWKKNRSKYDRTQLYTTSEDLDEVDTWDALSNDIDPTERR